MVVSETPEHRSGAGTHLARDLTLYLLARFGLVVLVAAILAAFGVPLLVAVAIGFVVGVPAGLLLLRPLNRRVTAGLAARKERRDRERAELRAQLRGDTPSDGADRVDGETDSRGESS